jgi:hypothetical protein
VVIRGEFAVLCRLPTNSTYVLSCSRRLLLVPADGTCQSARTSADLRLPATCQAVAAPSQILRRVFHPRIPAWTLSPLLPFFEPEPKVWASPLLLAHFFWFFFLISSFVYLPSTPPPQHLNLSPPHRPTAQRVALPTSCCTFLTHNIGKVLCDGRVSSGQLVRLRIYLICGWPSPTAIRLAWRFTIGLLITSLVLSKLKLARSQQVVGCKASINQRMLHIFLGLTWPRSTLVSVRRQLQPPMSRSSEHGRSRQ